MLTTLHIAIVLWMTIPFPYFMTAGANVFTVTFGDSGAMLGELSFVSGMLCVLCMGLFRGLLLPPALCGAILALGSLMLYEWTRRTVVDPHFYVALSGEVPGEICDTGPYSYLRHPFYSSYMLVFLGVAIAFPSLVVSAVCVLNIGLFVYMAMDDERVLLCSTLGADYRSYRGRVGMFVPRLKR